jgi:murein DD-endopeptidase MepM/ murein hydrolase activator NlpD
MLRTKIFPLVVILGLLFSSSPLLAITAEAQQFHQGNISTENFKSPSRKLDAYGQPTIDDWRHINSAWNQPRNVIGTNPHEGTDLRMLKDEPVYSVFEGTVVQRGTDWLLIKRTNQNVYMDFVHIGIFKGIDDIFHILLHLIFFESFFQQLL